MAKTSLPSPNRIRPVTGGPPTRARRVKVTLVGLALAAVSFAAGAVLYLAWPSGGAVTGSPSFGAASRASTAADADRKEAWKPAAAHTVRSGGAAYRSGPRRPRSKDLGSSRVRVRPSRAASTTRERTLAASPNPLTLCAKQGSVSLPGNPSVSIWGFAEGPCASAGAATLPGPALVYDEGENVSITVEVDSGLSQAVSLALPGQSVTRNGSTYTFTASRPGTFLYEAGGLNAPRQVAMGLYGSLVVQSSIANQAYGTAASAYDSDAVLVLSEIDLNLNADPAGFDLLDYAPSYWLINGKAYPQTAEIPVAAGAKVLLRYVNAGLSNHTMELLGVYQREIAKDAFPTPYPLDLVSETLPSGSTGDLIVTVPNAAPTTRFPLFNRQLHLTNGDDFPGGMLTFLTVSGP
jgi:FtsP/CotA-like multicopper oxidase with cupredoxin domain